MGTLLTLLERTLDRAFWILEWARDAHEDYLQRKRIRAMKTDLDALGMQLKTRIEGAELARGVVVSLPRHRSKVVH